jgi:hypothetical protein
MIPNGATTTLESTMTPEATIGMTIDEGAMAHIMSVLTDLYSDPIAAVIREYSTNGYDAHVEAGITRPIEVNLPSVYAQTFTVRDYGLGLDLDDLYRIYSRYGASTKRESNDVVGMLGLGCKSGLTFTNQFSMCLSRMAFRSPPLCISKRTVSARLTLWTQRPPMSLPVC